MTASFPLPRLIPLAMLLFIIPPLIVLAFWHYMLMILCINARDAMGEKGVIALSLRLRRGLSERCTACASGIRGDYIELGLADHGPGIAEARFGRLFDPFLNHQRRPGKAQRHGSGGAAVAGPQLRGIYRSNRRRVADAAFVCCCWLQVMSSQNRMTVFASGRRPGSHSMAGNGYRWWVMNRLLACS